MIAKVTVNLTGKENETLWFCNKLKLIPTGMDIFPNFVEPKHIYISDYPLTPKFTVARYKINKTIHYYSIRVIKLDKDSGKIYYSIYGYSFIRLPGLRQQLKHSNQPASI